MVIGIWLRVFVTVWRLRGVERGRMLLRFVTRFGARGVVNVAVVVNVRHILALPHRRLQL
jgi:hypothetical protein